MKAPDGAGREAREACEAREVDMVRGLVKVQAQ